MRAPKLFSLALIAILLVTAIWPAQATVRHTIASAAAASTPGVSQLTATDEGVSFAFNVPAFTVGSTGQIEASGLETAVTLPGAPELPTFTRLIALPPGAEASVTVDVQAEVLTAVPPIRSVPQAIPPDPGPDGGLFDIRQLATERRPDDALYGANAFYPSALYELSAPGYVRDLRLARLTLYPLRYNPVTGQLHHIRQMQVNIRFSGGQTEDWRPAPSHNDQLAGALESLLLNPVQARGWRSLPADFSVSQTVLPIGVDTYKIEVKKEGIYEVTYADLQAAGMDVNSVDPRTFQMLYRGDPVAYQFIGDVDGLFEPGEKIRFYGWPFNDNRLERDFIVNNVYWLWAGGTPAPVNGATNNTSYATVTQFPESITSEPEFTWFPTWTNNWPTFPNEPDAWYWTYMAKDSLPALTYTFPITLYDPVSVTTVATYTFEITSYDSPRINDVPQIHDVRTFWPPDTSYRQTFTWHGKSNRNLAGTLPQNLLTDISTGVNSFGMALWTNTVVGSPDRVYINRLTVDYLRHLRARNDELIFGDQGGQRTFELQNVSEGNADNLIVWNVSDRLNPVRIIVTNGDRSGTGPYTYRVGSDDVAGVKTRFIATTQANVRAPLAIGRYVPPDLEPAGGGADWVAVAHGNFISGLAPLTSHRQNPTFGGLSTHVVNIADLINQYGYGLPVPASIRDYLAHALGSWQVPPSYLTLVGDATMNPRQVLCAFGCSGNPMNQEPQYVLTDLIFADRFQGQIPSDTPFVMLVGDPDDYYVDLGVGRLPVQTTTQLSNLVNKIIAYETAHLTPESWQESFLFVSDDPDSGGDFCAENAHTGLELPAHLNDTHLCLPVGAGAPDTVALRTQMFEIINGAGVPLVNYRGHGSITAWGGAGGESILKTTHTGLWLNSRYPIMLSADCLDGYFAFPATPGLGETFLKIQLGTAGHWSSTGLGYSVEHTALHLGFYKGLYEEGLTAVGDAISFAKNRYVANSAGHVSEFLSFTYLGDPATQLFRQDLSVSKVANTPMASNGDLVDFTITITNSGAYASPALVTDTLPAGLNFVSATASRPVTQTVNGNDVLFKFYETIPWNGTAVINLQAQVDTGGAAATLVNNVVANGFGLEINPGDETASATVTVMADPLQRFFMPYITR